MTEDGKTTGWRIYNYAAQETGQEILYLAEVLLRNHELWIDVIDSYK